MPSGPCLTVWAITGSVIASISFAAASPHATASLTVVAGVQPASLTALP